MTDTAKCLHVGYHEEAGGLLVCDDCGDDITFAPIPADPAPAREEATMRAELQRIAEWSCVACDDEVRHVCHRHAIFRILAGLKPIMGEVSYPCACTDGGAR